jgi:hypothetical protein
VAGKLVADVRLGFGGLPGGLPEACKLFDHDDEQHNDRDSDFVLNLNSENVLIAKDY